MRKSFFASALIAGLIAGTLDIIGACISAYLKNEVTPVQVLKYIAAGAADSKTFSNETVQVLCGLLIHFLIAISFTFLFFLLARMIPSIVRNPIPVGILYGIFVWAAMRFIILPNLSRHVQKPIEGKEAIINASIAAGILIVCIGIPVALLAKRYVKSNRLT